MLHLLAEALPYPHRRFQKASDCLDQVSHLMQLYVKQAKLNGSAPLHNFSLLTLLWLIPLCILTCLHLVMVLCKALSAFSRNSFFLLRAMRTSRIQIWLQWDCQPHSNSFLKNANLADIPEDWAMIISYRAPPISGTLHKRDSYVSGRLEKLTTWQFPLSLGWIIGRFI